MEIIEEGVDFEQEAASWCDTIVEHLCGCNCKC